MSNTDSMWAKKGEKENNSDLDDLLKLASDNYGRFADHFFRHKDSGIKMLTLLLTAEFVIFGFFYLNREPEELFIGKIALLIFSILSLIITCFSYINCKRSYKAFTESAVLITKMIWAKGLTKPITLNADKVDWENCPVKNDLMPYVPRYFNEITWKDKEKKKRMYTTVEVVNFQLRKKNTTYFAAKWTIITIGILAFVSGVLGLYFLNRL